MDILTHTLSGVAIGTCTAAFTKGSAAKKTLIIAAGAFGGALPDIDAISLWSGFDSTFGYLFGLDASGREIYSGKFWFSHHNFFHSIAAGLMFSGLIFLLLHFIANRKSKIKKTMKENLAPNFLYIITFFSGFIVHLLEDMPTPASAWGGVHLFWPFDGFVGGFGYIWWWNNYDVFLIILSAVIANSVLHIINHYKNINLKLFTAIVLCIALFASLYQIGSRDFDFNYTSNTKIFAEYEHKSLKIQREILGDKLYSIMKSVDNKLKINF